jgi:hypothetical protein
MTTTSRRHVFSTIIHTILWAAAPVNVPLSWEIFLLVFLLHPHTINANKCRTSVYYDEETNLGKTICYIQIQHGVDDHPASLPTDLWWISSALQLYRGVLLWFYSDMCIWMVQASVFSAWWWFFFRTFTACDACCCRFLNGVLAYFYTTNQNYGKKSEMFRLLFPLNFFYTLYDNFLPSLLFGF